MRRGVWGGGIAVALAIAVMAVAKPCPVLAIAEPGITATWHARTVAPGSLPSSVSCVSSSACYAVGQIQPTDVFASFWNGSRWLRQPAASPRDSGLHDVSCLPSNACTAVGFKENAGGTLVEVLHAGRWIIRAAPSQPSWSLQGVSCASANFCVAVGRRNAPPGSHGVATGSLLERWNGLRWQIVTAPSRSGDFLQGVSCATADSCVAVGASDNLSHPLAEVWDGRSWRRAIPPGPRKYWLTRVSCPTSELCVAVGGQENNPSQPLLIDRWSEGRWSRDSVSTTGYLLNGVSCPSAGFCVAVGSTYVPTNNSFPGVVETWNGTNWTDALLPVRPGYTQDMAGVSCPASTSCVAVGSGSSASFVWEGLTSP